LDIVEVDVREGVGIVDIYATLDRQSYKTTEVSLQATGLAGTNDYALNSNKIVFEPMSTRSHSYITIFEDDVIEGSEYIDIKLGNVSNGTVKGNSNMRVLILGDLKLNDTGAVSYYNNGQFDALVPEGQYPNQDAEYGLDIKADYTNGNGFAGASYNKIDNSGNFLPSASQGNACTFDGHTGLTWEMKGAPFFHTFHGEDADEVEEMEYTKNHYNNSNGLFRWYNADDNVNGGSKGGVNKNELSGNVLAANGVCMFPPKETPLYDATVTQRGCTTDKYVSVINRKGLCGNIDWRLPTITELQTLLIYEDNHRPIDNEYFSHTESSDAAQDARDFTYLSATPSVDNDASVWCLSLKDRQIKLCNKTEAHHIRLVRGNSF
jgi:hypothetical protein